MNNMWNYSEETRIVYEAMTSEYEVYADCEYCGRQGTGETCIGCGAPLSHKKKPVVASPQQTSFPLITGTSYTGILSYRTETPTVPCQTIIRYI